MITSINNIMKTILVYGRKIDESGGVENYIYNLYKNIDREKYYLILIIPYLKDQHSQVMEKYEKIFNKIYYIESHKDNLLKHIKQSSKIYRENKRSILHVHASNGFHAINGLIARINGVKKIVFHSHNSSGVENLNVKISRFIFKITGFGFLGCTSESAQYLFGKNIINHEHFMVARNAIDSKKYSFSDENRKNIREELAISEDTMLLGFVGRISEEKNLSFIIDIMKNRGSFDKPTKLLIVGDGPKKETITNTISKLDLEGDVKLLGARTDIDAIMSGIDILLLPSRYEALGIVLIEGQTSGAICLASNNVTTESKISDNIKYLDLNVDLWIDQINNISLDRVREGYDKITKSSGYDLASTTKEIEVFYDEL